MDMQIQDEKWTAGSTEELVEAAIDDEDPKRELKMGRNLE